MPNRFSNNVSIHLGQGDGTFLSAQHFGVGNGPYSVTVGDFNGDTIEDLAVASYRHAFPPFGADNVCRSAPGGVPSDLCRNGGLR